MSKVYITQENSSVDYMPATKFGDLVFITGSNQRLSNHANSLENKLILNQIATVLEEFDPEDDYLLCTGSPTIMAICGAVLGDNLFKILNWDNRAHEYYGVNI
jgi:hypothetical protein